MDGFPQLSNGGPNTAGSMDTRRQNHQYPLRHIASGQDMPTHAVSSSEVLSRPSKGNPAFTPRIGFPRSSPAKKDQKHVVFQLIDPEDPRIQARLPMRVMISPHDTTDSIITTVKNFYGLYEYGVSFENKQGISIIAAFDNFENDMVVFVRTVAQPPASLGDNARDSASPKKPTLGAPFEMRPPLNTNGHSPSRRNARSAGARSMSPQSDIGGRSASAAPGTQARSQRTKSKDNSVMGDVDGYGSDDNDHVSVTSSRRSKAEEIKAEITVDNIVEGGRRKRAFESSELPLFVPPQVPMSASISSISPQRISRPPQIASPYTQINQQTFSYTQPLPSPQSYGSGAHYMQPGFPTNPYQNGFQQYGRPLRGGRANVTSQVPTRHSSGAVLPTPDPTVGSVISDEDVALQLMRLGDPTAFSHGRTSTSTVDDALSGKAEAASSDEDDDDDGEDQSDEERKSRMPAVPRYSTDDVGPQKKRRRMMNEPASDDTSGEEYEDVYDGTFRESSMGIHGKYNDATRKMSKPKSKTRTNSPASTSAKMSKPRTLSISKPKKASNGQPRMPMSPASVPQSRKGSFTSQISFQHQLGADEEDLSSKPRCQRCRKSKKGCDRQRPCGRCKDAGIGIEGCISEDEGNGRRGRYGRHMGVPITKGEETFMPESTTATPMGLTNGYFLAPALPDKSKKRKR